MNFKVTTYEEYTKLLNSDRIDVSEIIVNNILKNINNKKEQIFMFSVNVAEEDTDYNVTMNRKDFIDSLEKNLKIYEKYEKYEFCIKIVEAINILKRNN